MTIRGNLRSLERCARDHLDAYMDPTSDYAFQTYDRQGDPHTLTPVDFFAPELLSVDIWRTWVRDMFKPSGPWSDLRAAMQAVLDDDACRTADFIDVDLSGGAWKRVDAAVYAAGNVKRFRGVAVTKTLHRKRPNLVPILDSVVFKFFMGKKMRSGPFDETPRAFWPVLQSELRANRDWLAEVVADRKTPDNRPLSVLRAADIIVWTHATTGCKQAGN